MNHHQGNSFNQKVESQQTCFAYSMLVRKSGLADYLQVLPCCCFHTFFLAEALILLSQSEILLTQEEF